MAQASFFIKSTDVIAFCIYMAAGRFLVAYFPNLWDDMQKMRGGVNISASFMRPLCGNLLTLQR